MASFALQFVKYYCLVQCGHTSPLVTGLGVISDTRGPHQQVFGSRQPIYKGHIFRLHKHKGVCRCSALHRLFRSIRHASGLHEISQIALIEFRISLAEFSESDSPQRPATVAAYPAGHEAP